MKKNTVHDLIRQKKYFDVGFHWYFDRYLSFFWQKRLFYFLFFITFFTFGYLFYMNKEILIDSKIISPILIYKDNYDEFGLIKKLKSPETENQNLLISKYLVEKYVSIRESYDFDNLNEQKLFIRNNSTAFLFLNFENDISISNINSPLLLYGKRDKISVLIKNVDLKIDDGNVPTKAKVEFSLYKNNDFLLDKKINMEFYMSDVLSVIKEDEKKFEFLVFQYNVL
jgi:type IV secretory pathway component VirB8